MEYLTYLIEMVRFEYIHLCKDNWTNHYCALIATLWAKYRMNSSLKCSVKCSPSLTSLCWHENVYLMVYSIQLSTWQSRYSAAYTGACLSSRYTSALSLSSVFPASHWLRNCRLRSGALTWPVGMRYAAKLPVNSNISVATRVAAQLHAGRPTLAEKKREDL